MAGAEDSFSVTRSRIVLSGALSLLFVLLASAVFAACPGEERIGAIVRAWQKAEPIRGLPADLAMADAVCIRDGVVERLQPGLGRIVGYKAGLTNKAIQQRFGVSSPVRGVLLEKMLLPDGAEVPAQFGARPVFEADLLVEVKDAGIHEAKTHLEVLRSLSRVMPFIELPDLVLAEGEKVTAPLIVLTNVGARFGVVGKGIPVEATEKFAASLAAMRVVVTDQDGMEIAKGTGAAILGHPLNAVLWLVEDLRKSGVRVKAGDVLSLGSFTPLLTPSAGMRIKVRYFGLPGDPEVSMRFK
ncbi:MAG: hypothetical protein A3F74_14820 [Betaproteobacteria bacterium RIFCSPLOWO2_12_FULL_62_58]|nr:MAG: hypothetical protein A3F74_14820 [Betaproteobacteria bacterium RIFCSPLOWO2_12_FULL_62_58]